VNPPSRPAAKAANTGEPVTAFFVDAVLNKTIERCGMVGSFRKADAIRRQSIFGTIK
jgi:hypothetical protein